MSFPFTIAKTVTMILLMSIGLPLAVTAQSSSSCEITFGQTGEFSGASWTPAPYLTLGIRSAFHEANVNGGVKGCQVKLVSMDDQYNRTKTVENMQTLLASHPDLVAFIGITGTPTTAAALPVAAAAERLIIGPMTGSSAFRKKFNPWTINLRSGYDDEVVDMLKLLVTIKKYRRISIVYQNDAFGLPALEATQAAMMSLKIPLTGVHPYSYSSIGSYDYRQFAEDVWSHKPQGIIMFGVSQFFGPFLHDFYALDSPSTSQVSVVVGSWAGDAPQRFFKTHPNLDPTNFHVTTVVPHPDEDLNVTKQYREAVNAYIAATSPSTSPTYDLLSVEGYLVGKLAVEALQRTPSPITPQKLRQSIYKSKMFEFDELLAGPFSDDCVHDSGRATGRSSLCDCNQGLRFVETTVMTKDYHLEKFGEPFEYPTGECFSTATMVQRPIVFGALFRNTSFHLSEAAQLTEIGIGLEPAISGSVAQLPLSGGSLSGDKKSKEESRLALDIFHHADEDKIMFGAIGGMHIAAEDAHAGNTSKFSTMVFHDIFGPAHLADEIFDERGIFMTATLQQEIFASVAYLQSLVAKSANAQKIIFMESVRLSEERNDVGLSVWQAFVNSLLSNGFDESSIDAEPMFKIDDYTGSDQDAAATSFTKFLESAKSSVVASRSTEIVNIFLYGIDVDRDAMIEGLLNFLSSNSNDNVRVFMSFAELGTLFHYMEAHHCPLNESTQLANCDEATHRALDKLYIVTHLPMWTASFANISKAIANAESTAEYSHTYAYHIQSAILKKEKQDHKVTNVHLYNPLVAMGYWLSEIANLLLIRTRGDASMESVIAELYHSSVLVIDGIAMGPFVNEECSGTGGSCLCNFGARTVDIFSVDDIFQDVFKTIDDSKPLFEYRFESCHVKYTLPTKSLTAAQLAGIIIGSVFGAICLMSAPSIITKYKAMRRVAAAPKDASEPYTLVFTDIQSSTNLWARLPDQMGGALDAHHELIRELIHQHNGYEVKTIGDAFMIAFKSPDDAVELCIKLQEEFYRFDWAGKAGAPDLDRTYLTLEMEMVEEDGPQSKRAISVRLPETLYKNVWNGLRVRCGIHTGVGEIKFEETTNGYDYYGNVANMAARTEAIGNGGQVCMTKATVSALKRCSKMKMTNLGGVELRGVPEPVEIFQLDEFNFDNGCDVSTREYAPLRLDKALEEREGVDDNTGTDSQCESERTQTTYVTDEFTKQSTSCGSRSGIEYTQELVEDNCNFKDAVATMLSTMDVKSKVSILQKVATKWRLKPHKKGDKVTFEELLGSVNRKVMGVISARKRVAGSIDKKTKSMSMSGTITAGDTRGRNQSIALSGLSGNAGPTSSWHPLGVTQFGTAAASSPPAPQQNNLLTANNGVEEPHPMDSLSALGSVTSDQVGMFSASEHKYRIEVERSPTYGHIEPSTKSPVTRDVSPQPPQSD